MQRPQLESGLEKLRALRERKKDFSIAAAFAEDSERFSDFSAGMEDLFLDWSKCALDRETMQALFALADASGLVQRRGAMFSGEHINATEDRAVLHVALRGGSEDNYHADGNDVSELVGSVLSDMDRFAVAIRSGAIKGADSQPFTDVVNIGIGGSDLGPVMVTRALSPFHDGPKLHFVSNVDGAHIADTLKSLDPRTTLVIVASKTFTTAETMRNAATARAWIADALGQAAVGSHFAAISTALDRVAAFGISPERTFGFWDWVGGRYSVWSAIGLPVMIAVGPDEFSRFLAGARTMDQHFRTAALEENLPVILGLVGFWHRALCGYTTRAVIPYDQRLERLPAYLQQLDMESNGKSVTLDGEPCNLPTGPIVWGEPGTNGQHAFFQLIHQGTDIVPVEFIVAANGHEPDLSGHHEMLLANCLAQSQALMTGRSPVEALARARDAGMDEDRARVMAGHKTFPGNRPSLTILHHQLTPYTLGRLIALYEHRVFVEAALYGINAYDQWGVELGKELATSLLPVIRGETGTETLDGSTGGLVALIQSMRRA